MAKRSYLNTSANYINAKPYMRGMSLGGAADNDKEARMAREKRILRVIIDGPTQENLARRWALGSKDLKGWEHEPTMPLDEYIAANANKDMNKKPTTGFIKHVEVPGSPGLLKTVFVPLKTERDDYLPPEKMYKNPRGNITSDQIQENLKKLVLRKKSEIVNRPRAELIKKGNPAHSESKK